jgi:hypothetical protein
MKVIPRVLTSSIYGNDSEEAKEAKWLRTMYVKKEHTRGCHDHLLSRHYLNKLGVTWPDINKDLRSLSNSCLFCLAESTIRKFRMQESEIYTEINDAWFLDLQGPFGRSKKYILSIIDDASGYGWLRRLHNKADVDVIRGVKSVFKEAKAVNWPKVIRSDNGFGTDFVRWCKRTTHSKLDHRTSTSENPSSQHRIERPHKLFRKWASDWIKCNEGEELTEEMVLDIESTWRQRPVHESLMVNPIDLYLGRADEFSENVAEIFSSRATDKIALLRQYTDLRKESAAQAYKYYLQQHGIREEETECKTGDFCLYSHLKENRKAKVNFNSNFRLQIFKVTKRINNRLFLASAKGDAVIRFKVPVHARRCIKIPEEYGKRLEFKY